MIKLLQSRSFAHGFCPSLGLISIASDVGLNPHHYGEVVHWTWRSTVIAGSVLAIWLVLMGITRFAGRR